MADLIDRQEAIEALCKAGCDSGHCGVSCPDVMAIEDLPSAYAVEVVRCRECKHWWDSIPSNITLMGKRWQYCQKQKEMCPEDGFCWMGEQMDGEQDG